MLGRDPGFVFVVTIVLAVFLFAVVWAAHDLLYALGWW